MSVRKEELYKRLGETLRRNGHKVHFFTPYQMRVDGILDIYPVNRRWHDIKRNERGEYNDLFIFISKFFNQYVKEKHVQLPPEGSKVVRKARGIF